MISSHQTSHKCTKCGKSLKRKQETNRQYQDKVINEEKTHSYFCDYCRIFFDL